MRNAQSAQERIAGMAEGERSLHPDKAGAGTTLEENVAFALANRPSMQEARLDVEDARLALKQLSADAPLASATPWNSFSADATLGHSESSASAHFDHLKSKTSGKASFSLSLDVLLWDFGRNNAAVRAQCERVLASELNLVKSGFDVFEEVSQAYFTRLQSDAILSVAITNRAMRSEHLARAEERLDAGEAQRLDVLRARLDLAEADEAVVAATNDVVTSTARLAASLGLEASSAPDLPGALSLEDAVRAFSSTYSTSKELFDFARTNSPAMKIARARLRAASADVDEAVANLMPRISATLGLNWTDPLWYWRWGFSAAQNLFSGFSHLTAVDRAVVAMDKAAAALETAELQLSLDIELAVAERDNAREALASAEASVISAKDNLDTVQEEFSIGDASRVEYSEATADYATALSNRVKAFYRGQLAEAALFNLAGVVPEYMQESK